MQRAGRGIKGELTPGEWSLRELAAIWDLPAVYSTISREIAPNRGRLGEVCRYLLASKGKGLRPLLVLICSAFGRLEKEKSIRLAAAMEMLHLAMLVHDDILDGSPVRRGVPTINRRWNDNTALLAGDYLFGKSLEIVGEFGKAAVERFAGVITESTAGEFLQAEAAFNLSLEISDYEEIIRKKTAVMLANCCAAAATACGAADQVISSLEGFGLNLGMAFQIRDDVADWSLEGKDLGKPVVQDLRQGLLTLPILLALQLSDSKDSIRAIIASKKVSDQHLSFIFHEIQKTGSLVLALETASGYTEKALQYLGFLPETPARQDLERLAKLFQVFPPKKVK